MSGQESSNARRHTEADQETFARMANYNPGIDKLVAEADARMVVARVLGLAAFFFFSTSVILVIAFVKSQMAWAKARLPFVWANAGGEPMLVSNATLEKTWEAVPEVVVQAEVRRFLDMRYGVSKYHVRQMWPSLTTYWLSRQQTNEFMQEMRPLFDDLQREGYWRRIQVRVIQFDKKSQTEDGGTRYLAQIEYLASDMREEDMEPKRLQLYKLKLDFSIGTPPGALDPNQLVLWAQNNPLNFRVFETLRSAPVEISSAGLIPNAGASGASPVAGATAGAGVSPVVPIAPGQAPEPAPQQAVRR